MLIILGGKFGGDIEIPNTKYPKWEICMISENNDISPISDFCDIALLSSCLMNISKIL